MKTLLVLMVLMASCSPMVQTTDNVTVLVNKAEIKMTTERERIERLEQKVKMLESETKQIWEFIDLLNKRAAESTKYFRETLEVMSDIIKIGIGEETK